MSIKAAAESPLELLDPLFEELVDENRAVDAEIARDIDRILGKFWQHYPQLGRVPQQCLSLESMQAWLAQHREGGPV